jgi:hypothetical protein
MLMQPLCTLQKLFSVLLLLQEAGGPKIPMKYGRVDVTAPEQCPPEVCPPVEWHYREHIRLGGPGQSEAVGANLKLNIQYVI